MSDPAGPYRHILVGTDGSVTAGDAVSHAAELAKACGAKLTVMSAYAREEITPGQPRTDPGFIATSAAGANDHVVAASAAVRALGVTEVGARTEAGDPASAMLDVAADIGADLIVVGSRGMSTSTRFVLGSVPNRVSHHAPCDVIIVRTAD